MLKRLAAAVMPKLLRRVPKHLKLLYPFYLAGRLEVKEEIHARAGMPEALDGFALAYASDIHFGPLFTSSEAERLYGALTGLRADLVVLGGDFGDTLRNGIAFFRHIPAFPIETPVIAVLGNHDYGRPGEPLEPLLETMRDKNVLPLVNQVFSLERGGKRIDFCGPDDIQCGRPDLQALAALSRAADYRLFLPHSPDLIPEAFAEGLRFDLAVCGHTHGGQIVLFGRSLHSSSSYGDRYRSGWYSENGADILVSNGVGTSILPMRLNTHPQIHRLVFRAIAEAQPGDSV